MNECPRAPPTLTAENFEAIDEILKLLEPFELATTTVSGEHFITSSLIIPLTRGILMKLTSFEKNLITDEGKDVLKSLTNSVKSRLKPYTTRTAAILATILDARFKKYGFLLSQDADHAMQLLQKEYASYLASKSKAAEPLRLPEPSTHIASTSKIDELLFFSSDNQQVSTPVSDAIIDIRQYIEKPVIDRSTSPLEYWHKSSSTLRELAFKYLSIPATSVPTERIFSKAGDIMTKKRNRLKDKNLDTLLFIKHNYSFFKT